MKAILYKCEGCGGEFAPIEGPIHDYMLSSPACWNHYGQVLAREYESPSLFSECHRLTVDSYALQHAGRADDRRAVQSVWLHFISLHLIYAHECEHNFATQALKSLVTYEFSPLPEYTAEFTLTVADISNTPVETHAQKVFDWAQCTYEALSPLKSAADDIVTKIGLIS